MVAIVPTTTSTPSLGRALLRARVDQAQREADRAEAEAKDLRSRAERAEQEAEGKQGRADGLAAQARQTDLTYRAPSSRTPTSQVPPQTQEFLERLYRSTRQQFADSGNPLKTDANAPAVLNSQGQATGRILNIRA